MSFITQRFAKRRADTGRYNVLPLIESALTAYFDNTTKTVHASFTIEDQSGAEYVMRVTLDADDVKKLSQWAAK